MRLLLALALSVGLALPAAADTAQPIDALRGPVEQVLAILKDPRYSAAATKKEQRDHLWEIIRGVFDYRAISARAVGRNWRLFDPGQQQAFTDAFSELLGNSYLSRIQGAYKNERVEFLGQELLENGTARVKSRIVRDADAIAVDYSLQREAGAWKVYDVNIAGVSLVQNYRSQFDQILGEGTPAQLIERVKAKNSAQAEK
ncbi:MAG TPA: ABC transporter substrate-binding protein [bacterium]